MFNVCPQCGEYSVEKTIDLSGPYAICPFCHYTHSFLQQPLFIITGPSTAGKSTVCLELVAHVKECVVMESDILWGTSESDYYNMWLRVAKNIGQAGRPVVLCGTFLPEQLERCSERRYFSTLHYLAMVCDDSLLSERLRQRPGWRKAGSDDVVGRMIQFNHRFKEHATITNPAMTLYDNSQRSVQESTNEIAQWIRERL